MNPVQKAQSLEIFEPFIMEARKTITAYKKMTHAPSRIHRPPFIVQLEEQRETVLAALCALSAFQAAGNLGALHPEFSEDNGALSQEINQFIRNVVYDWRLKFVGSEGRSKAFFVHKTIQVLNMGPLGMNELYNKYEGMMPELFGIIELHQ